MRVITILFLLFAGLSKVLCQEGFPELPEPKILRGELVFADSINRRGTLRLHLDGNFQEKRLHHFAMLPHGMLYYRGAPAALQDIPIGTNLYGRFYPPADPKTSVVPIVTKPSDSQPEETHTLLLEDGLSLSLRTGNKWLITDLDLEAGTISAKSAHTTEGLPGEHTFTIDASTKVWRGRQLLTIDALKRVLPSKKVYLSLTWHPGYLYQKFHLADIWLDDKAVKTATFHQHQIHQRYIKHRWMPARIISVAYGEYGEGVVTAVLHGGMSDTLYKDFKTDTNGQMAAAESTLRTFWQDHDGIEGKIISVTKQETPVLSGSSGIIIQFKTDLLLAGFQPGRIVRVRPNNWPKIKPPVEQRILTLEDRWPSHDVFE